jgi:hypothetical protein
MTSFWGILLMLLFITVTTVVVGGVGILGGIMASERKWFSAVVFGTCAMFLFAFMIWLGLEILPN